MKLHIPLRLRGTAVPALGGLWLVGLGIGAPGDWSDERPAGSPTDIPHLCLTLHEVAEIPNGSRITRIFPESFGPPIGYNEAPSSLVALGGTEAGIPLPGRRPVGLRVEENRDSIELLDQNRGEMVHLRAGRVVGQHQLPIDEANQLVGGVWHEDRWHLLTRSDSAAWSVISFAYLDGSYVASSVPLPDAANVHIGAVGAQIVLIELDRPHRALVMDADHGTDWRALGEVKFKGDVSGRKVALVPLAIEDFALMTIVDQASAARSVRLVHVITGEFRDSRIDIPMAFISVDPSGWLYAIRETRGRELLKFSWTLSDQPCGSEPQSIPPSRR